jgi:hypothetical protein
MEAAVPSKMMVIVAAHYSPPRQTCNFWVYYAASSGISLLTFLGQLFSPMFKETLGATCQKMAEILKMVK